MKALEARLQLPVPLKVGLTLRLASMWGAATWLKVEPEATWYARRSPEGPATVCIRQQEGALDLRAWGPGAEALVAELPQILGLQRPGLEDLVPHHPLLASLKKRFAGLRVARTGQVFPRLVAAGLAQKVTGANSKVVLKRLAYSWGEPAPGPREDLVLLPEPKQLANTPYYAFHPLGIERHRAELVRRIASRASALQRAAGMPPVEARAHLEKLPGIGPWTSGVVMGGPLGDPDAVPVGDYHLPNIVAWNLAGEDRADDARMLELLAPYAGFRGLVARLVKSGGASAPRYGPRTEVRDIRRM